MTTQLTDLFRTRIVDEILFPFTEDDLVHCADLTEDVIDSMGIIEILELIEDVYGLHIDEVDVERKDFTTFDAIVALVGRHT